MSRSPLPVSSQPIVGDAGVLDTEVYESSSEEELADFYFDALLIVLQEDQLSGDADCDLLDEPELVEDHSPQEDDYNQTSDSHPLASESFAPIVNGSSLTADPSSFIGYDSARAPPPSITVEIRELINKLYPGEDPERSYAARMSQIKGHLQQCLKLSGNAKPRLTVVADSTFKPNPSLRCADLARMLQYGNAAGPAPESLNA
ncbi:hypothetical protein K488DRAFT_75146 [Vararia minispora EC-137]|uniref:Uncharacterized protein n=1 Tax=Vararia minispora EC-137 TaxID=1314806 RepID=A0ACB8Q529_9AGAM|nr:hypothetical protein K488DRAFT_75146 [Vararia minispora EC-137]